MYSKARLCSSRSFYAGVGHQLTIRDIIKKRNSGNKISMITAYDFPTASVASDAGVDMVLVGDSAANVVHGMKKTGNLTSYDMLTHINAVGRGIQRPVMVGDLPLLASLSIQSAVECTAQFSNANCGAVKLETGDSKMIETLSSILPTIAHLGVQPQVSTSFATTARTFEDAVKLAQDAMAVERAGASFLVLEKVAGEAAAGITRLLAPTNCLTIGIGAGKDTDGQVLVYHDVIGLSGPGGKSLPFAQSFWESDSLIDGARTKRVHDMIVDSSRYGYSSGGQNIRGGDGFRAQVNAVRRYTQAVRNETFPQRKHWVNMLNGDHAAKFDEWVERELSRVSQARVDGSITPSPKVATLPPPFTLDVNQESPRVLMVGSGNMAVFWLNQIKSNYPSAKIDISSKWESRSSVLKSGDLSLTDSNAKVHTIPKVQNTFSSHEDVPVGAYDVVILSSKVTSDDVANQHATLAISSAKKGGVVVSLTNGLSGLRAVEKEAKRQPSVSVVMGVTNQGVAALRGKESIQGVRVNGRGTLTLASSSTSDDSSSADHGQAVQFVSRLIGGHLLGSTEVETSNSEMKRTLWLKLAANSAINPVSSLINTTNGDILKDDKIRALAVSVVRETASVARDNGIDISDEEAVDFFLKTVEASSSNRSSMSHDIHVANRPTEISSINGAIISSSLYTPTPLNSAMFSLVSLISSSSSNTPPCTPSAPSPFTRVSSVSDLLKARRTSIKEGKRIAYVPMMGGLHDGHLALVKHAHAQPDVDEVWVSLFLNPKQFQDKTDFDTYPLIMEEDLRMLRESGHVNLVFTPSVSEVYPEPNPVSFNINPDIVKGGEHAMRPGFFAGIYAVLTRFFSLFQPDVTVFGQKDFQQVCMVRHLLSNISPATHLVVHPIVRAQSGLALSSRNARMSPEQVSKASGVFRVLSGVKSEFNTPSSSDIKTIGDLKRRAVVISEKEGIVSHYLNIGCGITGLDFEDDTLLSSLKSTPTVCHMSGSVKGSAVRLIDNMPLNNPPIA